MRFALTIISIFGMNWFFSTQPFYDYRIAYWYWATTCLFIPPFLEEGDKQYTRFWDEFFDVASDMVYRTLLWFIWGMYIGGPCVGWFLLGYLCGLNSDWSYLVCFFFFSFIGAIFGPAINKAILDEVERNDSLRVCLQMLFLYELFWFLAATFSNDPNSRSRQRQMNQGTLLLFILFAPFFWFDHNDKQNLRGAFKEENCSLIYFHEQNEEAKKLIVNEARRYVIGKTPTLVLQEVDGLKRLFFKADLKLPNLPTITWIEQYSWYEGEGDRQTIQTHFWPHYALFKGPNAIGKMKVWLKENGYKNWEFRLDMCFGPAYGPMSENFKAENSELMPEIEFIYKGRDYSWSEGCYFKELGLNKTTGGWKYTAAGLKEFHRLQNYHIQMAQ